MANNYQVKEGDGTSSIFAALDIGGVKHPKSIPTDASGTPYGDTNPLMVEIAAGAGGTGDASAANQVV